MTIDRKRRELTLMGMIAGAALFASSQRGEAASADNSDSKGESSMDNRKTTVTVLLYEGVTMLDWIGPYEALHRVPGIELIIAGKTTGLMKSDSGLLDFKANAVLGDVQATDVLLIPGGGMGMKAASEDRDILAWIRKLDTTSQITASVCTGSLILARAGLLKGKRATTHWQLEDALNSTGATYVPERWIIDGKYWTSAGVSAGIDMSLALIAALYGPEEAMKTQLKIEYDPHPPFNSGSVKSAPKEVVDAVRMRLPKRGG